MTLIVGLIKTTFKNIHKYVIFKYAINKKYVIMIITNPQKIRNISFSNMQLAKKHAIIIIL